MSMANIYRRSIENSGFAFLKDSIPKSCQNETSCQTLHDSVPRPASKLYSAGNDHVRQSIKRDHDVEREHGEGRNGYGAKL
jgi:hypothetical protein